MKKNVSASKIKSNNTRPQDQASTSASAKENTKNTNGPRQIVEQAARDVKHGLHDTERRGIPSNVPGPQEKENQSQGTKVPPEGVSRTR